MREYPSIGGPTKGQKGKKCYVFEKYDGSNLRCEWQPKTGWAKFGSRTRLFDHTDNQFADAIPLFNAITDDIYNRLSKLIKKKNYHTVTIFAEYFGMNSFAGVHWPDEQKDLRLFDVALNGKLMLPKDFWHIFHDQPYVAELLGKDITYGQQLIDDVKAGKWDTEEGVVCKGLNKKGNLWMSKIKTQAYIDKLIEVYKADWRKYAE